MKIVVEKSICLLILFLDGMVGGLLPIILFAKWQNAMTSVRGQRVLSLINCVAGGIFLGNALLNLMLEGYEQYERFKALTDFGIDYPFFHLAVGIGFFLVALVEKLAGVMSRKKGLIVDGDNERMDHLCESRNVTAELSIEADQERNPRNNTDLDRKRVDDNSAKQTEVQITTNYFEGSGKVKHDDNDTSDASSNKRQSTNDFGSHGEVQTPNRNGASSNNRQPANDFGSLEHGQTENRNIFQKEDHDVNKCVDCRKEIQIRSIEEMYLSSPVDAAKREDTDQVRFEATSVSKGVRAVMMLLALSFHTLFDGLAVGLQDSSARIWTTTTAISIHKVLVAVSLGLELALAFPTRPQKAAIFLFLFALVAPVGVALGIVVTSGHVNESVSALVGGILQALATGSFLYVTFFEVLNEELGRNSSSVKVLCTVCGFGAMAVAKIWDTD